MVRFAARTGLAALLVLAPSVRAQQVPQEDQTTIIDSVAVQGNRRTSRAAIVAWANIPLGQPISWRSIQRAMEALYQTGQFSSVQVWQGTQSGQQVLRFDVHERPLVSNWTVRGVEKLSDRKVRGKVRLLAGRPYDPAAAYRSKAGIDSLYEEHGFYLTDVQVRELPQPDSTVRVVFDVTEGRRVTVSQVVVDGNDQLHDKQVVGHMATKPEGFWWFRKGEYSDDRLELDVRDRLPTFYGSRGFIDFQVLHDTLLVNTETGKATLQLRVDEGEQYRVASFEIQGNRKFSTQELDAFFPFGELNANGTLRLRDDGGELPLFDQAQWTKASQDVSTLYANEGYIYVNVRPVMTRRRTPDGKPVVDLRWQIAEGNPAIVNKVIIRGNTTTHEDVIRRALLVVPGDVVRQQALIRSYQNISNLGFFEQPLPPPDIQQANDKGDVNIVFNVEERHTGNINFGASVGQGVGVGGFIGLAEPNLFGKGKQIDFRWQFGRNVTDFNISYTDPALRGGFMSGTVSLHSSRYRYTIADLGRVRSRGGSVRLGVPVGRSRYTRLFWTYTLEQSQFDSPTVLGPTFRCSDCVLSAFGVSLVRDTRIEMPFPTGGAMHRIDLSQGGGPLGGSGNFRRLVLEGRWYAPLATLGDVQTLGSPIKVVVGLSTQMGFIWGNAEPHFRQLFSMGGVQFGIPLRGYDEFAITPNGFDPAASGFRASRIAFGNAYFQSTAEVGLRLNQSIYFNTFLDAGNLWDRPSQFNPTQLFRGAGVGVSLVTPLGPIGLDYAYGFDRTDAAGNPDPGWKFHFKLGNFF